MRVTAKLPLTEKKSQETLEFLVELVVFLLGSVPVERNFFQTFAATPPITFLVLVGNLKNVLVVFQGPRGGEYLFRTQ